MVSHETAIAFALAAFVIGASIGVAIAAIASQGRIAVVLQKELDKQPVRLRDTVLALRATPATQIGMIEAARGPRLPDPPADEFGDDSWTAEQPSQFGFDVDLGGGMMTEDEQARLNAFKQRFDNVGG